MEKWKNSQRIIPKKLDESVGERSLEYLNPIQPVKKNNVTKIINTKNLDAANKKSSSNFRRTRSDKTKQVKFPVNQIERMKLRSYCKQAQRIYRDRGLEPLSQTKFNNVLLRFGLNHLHLVKWDRQYKDTGTYMHTNILETEYAEIGGPHGLAVRKNLSERKIVYFIIISVVKWMEGEGSLEEILQ